MLNRFLITVPLYNHSCNITAVVDGIFAVSATAVVLVVNDGSTDDADEVLRALAARYNTDEHADNGSLHCIRHERNLGKGAAILTAAAWAEQRGFTHLVTLDADTQHNPKDIPVMTEASLRSPHSILVGARNFRSPNIPFVSRFGRSFSGFWMRVQTGQKVDDMQCGFRVYPVYMLRALSLVEKRFAFELEVLVKAAWSGCPILSVPIQVYYPPPSERISHFRIVRDNICITLMNTKFTVRALIPLPFKKQNFENDENISLLRPMQSLRKLLRKTGTPYNLALSTFIAVMLNMLPLPGLQSIFTLAAIGRFHLNRVWTLALHHALWPPLLIPISVEGGYWLRHGEPLTGLSWEILTDQAWSRLLEWILGGLVFGPVVALLCALPVFCAAKHICSCMNADGENHARTA
jgi:glycosyltransferase involved in cell wall biosynthesis